MRRRSWLLGLWLCFLLFLCPLVETSEVLHHRGSSSSSSSGSSGERLRLNLTVGYLTGSARRPGDQEYSRPGLTISGALTLALSDLRSSNLFNSVTIVYPNGTRFKREAAGTTVAAAATASVPSALELEGSSGVQVPMGLSDVDINFVLEIAETYGSEIASVRQVANLWKKNVSVIIGPQESCLHEAMLAASFNIPMITYFCTDEETSDKRRFPTFSRTRPPDAAISRAVASLLLKYGWTSSLTLIYSESSDDHRFRRVARSLSVLLQKQNISMRKEIPYRGPYYNLRAENPFDSIVAQTKDKTRIYLVISEYFEHLGFVLAMDKHKLLDRGDYLVIGVSIDDYEDEAWSPPRYFKCLLCDEDEKVDPQIFRSYIGIVASPPRNFTDFSHRVNEFMERDPFNFPNPLRTIGGYKKIRIEAAYLYDAVLLYAQALREVIAETLKNPFAVYTPPPDSYLTHRGQVPRNSSVKLPTLSEWLSRLKRSSSSPSSSGRAGRSNSNNNNNSRGGHGSSRSLIYSKLLSHVLDGEMISRKLRNITYRSATGHESEMDEKGDAKGNFTLVSLKFKNGEFGIWPVGFFRQSQDLPELQLTEEIDWVSGGPPASEPECGFTGEKCKQDMNVIIISSILFVLTMIGISGGYLVFRHWRLSRDMDALLWRIDKKDIHWENGQFFPVNRGSQASLAKFSTVFAPLVTYRERIFAAKAMDTEVLDSTMKHQLKMLREIRHENLNAFIGACLYDEGILLIQEYCSRGSIKDILDNGDLKLDDMFVSSLVGDLLRGLSYLHDSSQFRYHGNLKPTNCLVDSRWVLRLSDFGLTVARRGHYISHHPADIIVSPGNMISGGKFVNSVGAGAAAAGSGGGGGGGVPAAPSTTRVSFTNATTTTVITRTGSGSYNSSVRSQPRTVHIVTSPYLPPEFSEIIKNTQNRSVLIDSHRKGDMYSLGVILVELLKRESLATFLGMKEEREVRAKICLEGNSLWAATLAILSMEAKHSSSTSHQFNSQLSSTNTAVPPTTSTLAMSPSPGVNNNCTATPSHLTSPPPAPAITTTTTTAATVTATVTAAIAPAPINMSGSSSNLAAAGNNNNAAAAAAAAGGIIPAAVIDCLKDCLSFDPDQRPDIKSVRLRLRPLHKGMRSNIFDIMIGLMEKYANNLEILVDDRTKQLSEEKRKTESLLYELIPASVAEELKEGLRVPAQNYDCVSIYFSDIVGFTSMSAQSSPLEVVEFLNELYTRFDSVIENFDVYKVETIGDAYMVASGLPQVREGNRHAHEMARMALQLLETVTNFRIRHRPTETVKLRIGVHSGPCCAGVVGLKRPRYCLFGDTVNTASRMESTGQPLKIHCSEKFAQLLDGAFLLEKRGVVDVKGKGDMTTFWLLGIKPRSPSCHSLDSGQESN